MCEFDSEYSVFEQIEMKKRVIVDRERMYYTLKNDLENCSLEDVKEMYCYLKDDVFSTLESYYEEITQLKEEIQQLKQHKDVRLHFLFIDQEPEEEEEEMITIRLMGLSKDVQKSVKKIEKSFKIITVSKEYKNRNSEEVRVYVKVEND